jgi:excinuclease ABC subunit C
MELTQKAGSLPLEPGVYLFKDALGNILYVGKSSSLRNRVKS